MTSLRILLTVPALIAISACQSGVDETPAITTTVPAIPGVVSAADPRAAEAGAEILRQGGSATDAAIATMLALTVVEPQSSGIGGGGFFVRSENHADGAQIVTLDGRETAPAQAGPDWFLDANGEPLGYRDSVISGRSVGVPGNIALAAEAHRRYGRLEWAQLFAPAIRLASEGWELSPRSASFLDRSRGRADFQEEGRAPFSTMPMANRCRLAHGSPTLLSPELWKTLPNTARTIFTTPSPKIWPRTSTPTRQAMRA